MFCGELPIETIEGGEGYVNHHRRLEHPELPAMGRNYHSQTPRVGKDHGASLVAQGQDSVLPLQGSTVQTQF